MFVSPFVHGTAQFITRNLPKFPPANFSNDFQARPIYAGSYLQEKETKDTKVKSLWTQFLAMTKDRLPQYFDPNKASEILDGLRQRLKQVQLSNIYHPDHSKEDIENLETEKTRNIWNIQESIDRIEADIEMHDKQQRLNRTLNNY